MERPDRKSMLLKTFLSISIVIFTLSSGCLSEPLDSVNDLYNKLYAEIYDDKNYYQIDIEELTVPIVPAQKITKNEAMPQRSSNIPPGYQVSSRYYYGEFHSGIQNVICVYIRNTGDKAVHIYEFGFILLPERDRISQKTGVKIEPGEEKQLGFTSIKVPDDVDDISLQLHISMMVRSSSDSWYEYSEQLFEEITIKVSEKQEMNEPMYVSNPRSIFIHMNSKIEPSDIKVRAMASESAKKYPGEYNIYQICALFDDTRKRIKYVSDPRGNDLWSPPGDTLKIGAGDCEDYAILLASLIESIGGTSRIYLTDNHAFAAVYIGNDTEEIKEAIRSYYDPVPIYYTTDEYGSWLLLDPTSSMYAGGLPGGAVPADDDWGFFDTNKIIVIDIDPANE